MYADGHNGNPLFGGIALPAGRYTQIRISLASSEDAYVGSVPGLTYNNEVQLAGDATGHYPLRVPSAEVGIKLLPESPIVVTDGGGASLAVDFNLSDDVVEVDPNGSKEFILKPRLGYFDLASVGAVKGAVSFGNLSTHIRQGGGALQFSRDGCRLHQRGAALLRHRCQHSGELLRGGRCRLALRPG